MISESRAALNRYAGSTIALEATKVGARAALRMATTNSFRIQGASLLHFRRIKGHP